MVKVKVENEEKEKVCISLSAILSWLSSTQYKCGNHNLSSLSWISVTSRDPSCNQLSAEEIKNCKLP